MDSAKVDSSKMVTVGRFLDPAEAQMAKGAIEAQGIDVFLQGENANSLVPMAFRTRLQVSAEDEAAAKEILEAAQAGMLQSGKLQAVGLDKGELEARDLESGAEDLA